MSIVRTEIENGFTLTWRELAVDITSDGRFFTVYEKGRPVATITRPAVMGGTRKWQIHTVDGVLVAQGVGARSCFARFTAHWYRKVQQ